MVSSILVGRKAICSCNRGLFFANMKTILYRIVRIGRTFGYMIHVEIEHHLFGLIVGKSLVCLSSIDYLCRS